MKKQNWKKEFTELVYSADNSFSFFPFGGDSYDFDENRCLEFIQKLLDQQTQETKEMIERMSTTIHTPVGGYSNVEWIKKSDIIEKL